jgi:Protein of unknown function (DUF4038)/Putative collagen-binding domain of a collagenase
MHTRKRWHVLAVGAMLLAGPVVRAQSGLSYPLRISASGTYIVDQNNRPFFMNGDSGWSVISQLSTADATTYLENRRLKGFNTIVAELVEHKFASNAPANFYHDQPFTSAGNFNTPNEAYFAHADLVINTAAAKGQVMMLAPLYLGFGCGDEGWCAEVRNSSLATMRSWGQYVGTRYRGFPNIIWLIGGDVDPVGAGVTDKVQEFVAGLKETDPNHLLTFHGVRGQSAVAAWPGASWIDINDVYTDAFSYNFAATESARVPFKPFFLVESYYENEHSSTPLSLRSQAYWSVLAGGTLGHLFGNCPIWNFGAAVSFCTPSNVTWQSQLDSAGSTTVALVGRLFNSRGFFKLVPDLNHSVLTAGFQSGSTYAAAARTSDGMTIIAFIPTLRTVTIDMTKITGTSASVWWFNPRDGSATAAGTAATTAPRTFTPPDGNDWVLVLDSTSSGFGAPGFASPAPPNNVRIVR